MIGGKKTVEIVKGNSARPNVVSLYTSKPLVDGLSVSLSIINVVSHLFVIYCAAVSGKSFPIRSSHPRERLSIVGRNKRAPSVAILWSVSRIYIQQRSTKKPTVGPRATDDIS